MNKFIKIDKKNELENTSGSTMSQETLIWLTLLSIEKEILNELIMII